MSEAWWVARSTGGASSDAEARKIAIEAIIRALRGGIMETGDLTEQNGFRAWFEPMDDVIDRIGRESPSDRPRPELGDIGWLQSTPLGNELAARQRIEC